MENALERHVWVCCSDGPEKDPDPICTLIRSLFSRTVISVSARVRDWYKYILKLHAPVCHGTIRFTFHRETLAVDVEERCGLPLRSLLRQAGLQHRQSPQVHIRSP